jgi:hypothetical protein
LLNQILGVYDSTFITTVTRKFGVFVRFRAPLVILYSLDPFGICKNLIFLFGVTNLLFQNGIKS